MRSIRATLNDSIGLLGRLRLLSVGGILITGLLVAVATGIPMYQHARGQADTSMIASVRSQSQAVGQLFNNMLNIAVQVSSRTQIREELEAYNRWEISLSELSAFSAPRLRDALDQSGSVAGMLRFDLNDYPVISLGNALPSDWTLADWPASGGPIQGPMLLNQRAHLLARSDIVGRGTERSGTDVLLFDLSALHALLTNNAVFGTSVEQWLINADNRLAIKVRKPGGLLQLMPAPDLQDLIGLAEASATDLVIGEFSDLRGLHVTRFVTALPGVSGWTLAVDVPSDQLYAPVWSSLAIPISIIALLVLSGAALTSTVLKPVTRRLAEQSTRLADISQEQRSLLEMARGFVLRTDAKGCIVQLSPGAWSVLSAPVGSPVEEHLQRYLDPTLQRALARAGKRFKKGADIPPEVVNLRDAAGQALRFEISLLPLYDDDDSLKGLSGVARDVTQRLQAEERLRLAASVFEGSSEGIIITAADRRIIEANQAACVMTGHAAAQLQGQRICDVLCDTGGEPGFCESLWQHVAGRGGWQGETRFVHRDGTSFPIWLHISTIHDEYGHVERHIAIFADITERIEAQAHIQRLAHYDMLTALPNRVLLQDRLRHALDRSQRNQTRVALLFIDLDRFKYVNDSLGHAIGDRLLQVVALRFNSTVREQDTVARVGGDEFLVILEDFTTLDAPARVAQKIIDVLERPIRVDHHELSVGASIGISVAPNDGTKADDLIRCADTAMYQAKADGRNAYRYYTDEMASANQARFEIESGLRRALENGEFRLHYQPMACCISGRVIGVEALVRWQHPQRGMVPPDEFIPIAEDIGMIESLGAWVLTEACEQGRRWLDDGTPLRISVNLSGQQVSRSALPALVGAVLNESRLPAELLELEVTEGHVMDDVERCIEKLHALRALGVSLAVDDFGTGYSSLAYLKRLPVDRLKIDRSFVDGIPGDADDTAIVSTIVAMARQLGLKVVAEGVEMTAQIDYLRTLGCDEYQGYLLGRPVPPDELVLPQAPKH